MCSSGFSDTSISHAAVPFSNCFIAPCITESSCPSTSHLIKEMGVEILSRKLSRVEVVIWKVGPELSFPLSIIDAL